MKMSDICVGDVLIADDGFTCIEDGRECVVASDSGGDLYVMCQGSDLETPASGGAYCEHHLLIGQEDEDGEIVGFVKKIQSSS